MECKRDAGAHDLSKKWVNEAYKDFVIVAACICKAKHHADGKDAAKARRYAKQASDALMQHEPSSSDETMLMVKGCLLELVAEVYSYIDRSVQ